jgi:hypothetical protein
MTDGLFFVGVGGLSLHLSQYYDLSNNQTMVLNDYIRVSNIMGGEAPPKKKT